MRNFIARCKNLLLANSPKVSTHPARAGIPQVITVRAFRHFGVVVYYPTCPKGAPVRSDRRHQDPDPAHHQPHQRPGVPGLQRARARPSPRPLSLIPPI